MNRDPLSWISPVVAIAVMVTAVVQTLGALAVTGAFGQGVHSTPSVVSPAYQAVEDALDRRDPRFALEGLRDPFQFGAPPADDPAKAPTPPPVRLAAPVPVVLPVLTAIVWDSDPRALVRWQDREWTVREGGLFDEFQVVKISRDQVTLRRGDETIVLKRRNPGE